MSFCLPLEQTKKFIQALKDGVIDPGKLSEMDSVTRHKFFSDLVGEQDARDVNALFESKLLLKNQQTGLINWAKEVAGIKEPVRRDIISRIEKMDKVLNPTELKTFLQDLASKKLGTDVSFEEAQKIADLSKQLSDAKGSADRISRGEKRVALLNYTNELKLSNAPSFTEKLGNIKTAPLGTITEAVSDVAGTAKGIKASLDNSAIFRQGWRTMFTNPKIWADNALQSFVDIKNQVGVKASNDAIMNGIKADIYSRPNFENGLYSKMKLDIGTGEEAFPTSVPEKIPLFGRLYKASEVAYNGFLMRMRADIADKMVEIAKGTGVDLTDKLEVESIGKLVNSLTGRGSLGAFEKVGKQVNTVFFSPKSLKASFDFLTVHSADKMSGFARKQAALNLLKVSTGMAVILGTAKALNPKSVELDPRSSDFGKIKIGDTRFDVSGGAASLVTFAARELSQSSKSTITGKVTPLNSNKYGAQTGTDVFFNFLENKLSPAASVVKDLMNNKTYQGTKPTIPNEAANLFVPLPITNAYELMNDPNSANFLISILADTLGIATNTYSPKKK